jgi:hypothetical protein
LLIQKNLLPIIFWRVLMSPSPADAPTLTPAGPTASADNGTGVGMTIGEKAKAIVASSTIDEVMARDLIIPRESNDGAFFDVLRTGSTTDRTAYLQLLLDLISKAPSKAVMRVAGGCKDLDQGRVEALFKFVANGCVSTDGIRTFQGTVTSGGTRALNDDGTEKSMVTQLPPYLGRLFECMSASTTPVTGRMRHGEKGIFPSKYAATLDRRQHSTTIVSKDPLQFLGWDGDVRIYMEALEVLMKQGYPVSLPVINGGDITKDEALLALSKHIPIILVKGVERGSDELIELINTGGSLQDLLTSRLALQDRDAPTLG